MHGAVLSLGLLSLAFVLPCASAGTAAGAAALPESRPEARPEGAISPPRGLHRTWGSGHGFDTCSAPPLPAMAAWRKAYSIANIYIGGGARACRQPHLDRGWVRAVRRLGYRLIPTYVGPQAPCTRFRHRFAAGEAEERGWDSAEQAVISAQRLGIPERQPIYYDMEAYGGRERCRRAVMTFLGAWSERMEELGYVPGVYSSAASAIRHLAEADDITRPSAIWYARWDEEPGPYGDRHVPDHLWSRHQRIKQYRGGHYEKHGGIRMNVDSNYVDGPVY